jgi:NAD(P)-dependent dehydrogenase (short-subunit alcohol dehydrogenase family)
MTAVLITGPSPDGIGAESAYCLARANPRLLILAGRSQSKIQPVLDRVREQGVPAEFLLLDLSSQKSIRSAVDRLKGQPIKVDVLINNAAVMASPFSTTEDGIEMQFGTNQVGPFLFTNLLLQAGLIEDRIVNVSSSASVRKAAYLLAPLDDLSYNNGKSYDPIQAYCTSKIALVLSTRKLAAKLKDQNITAFSLNPGSIRSPLQRHMNEEVRKAAYATAYKESYDFQPPQPKTLEQGCSTQLRAALDPDLVRDSGAYLDDCQVVEYREHVEAYAAADRIWKLSEDLVGERF